MLGHTPVLAEEVIQFLDPRPGGRFIDVTVGAGGHSRAILEHTASDGKLLAIDQDESALKHAREALACFGPRVVFVQENCRNIAGLAAATGFSECDGVLADIGISLMMVEDPSRGFSFMREGPLDMRMDRTQPLTAADVLNTHSEKDIADILYNYGEERRSRPIARSIVRARPLQTTADLVRAIERVTGGPRYGRIHPATRTFQALRIVVITFHSLEDRIVKQRFRALAVPGRVLTKKVVTASEEELRRNPRARSAKLRAWERS